MYRVSVFTREMMPSSTHCRIIARRAAWKRCCRETRSICTPWVMAAASISSGVGGDLRNPSSRSKIRNAMMDFAAQVDMMSSDPALLSDRRRGEKHSTAKAPEPGKKSPNPP